MDPKTPYLSPEVINITHGEKENNRKYTKKNPPTISKISCRLREQYISEYCLRVIK